MIVILYFCTYFSTDPFAATGAWNIKILYAPISRRNFLFIANITLEAP